MDNRNYHNDFLRQFKKGEEQAFDFVFRENFAALAQFAQGIINDKSGAEDIVQDCFVSLWARRRNLHTIEFIKTYLYTAVRYQCLRWLEKRKKSKSLLYVEADTLSVEDRIVAAETAKELYKLLENLLPGQRDVAKLYYFEGKSYSEISQLLQISPQLARLHRYRAILALRKRNIPLS